MTITLAMLIILSGIWLNTGVSFTNPFGDAKSVLTIVGLVVVWILILVGHLA